MTFLMIVLAGLIGWGLLGPYFITAGLKERIEKLEAQVAALRAQRMAPPATQPITAPIPHTTEPVAAAPPTLDLQPRPAMPAEAPKSRLVLGREDIFPDWSWETIERWLVQRWIIAAGGLTAALGGLFIVRYTIEQGLLGPTARVVLGGLVGLGLIAGAEWLRRHVFAQEKAPGPFVVAQAPAALAAAGWVTLYGVTYAAHAFYDLIPAAVAFALLAAIAVGSLAAALKYGALTAVLGSGMALLAPALVASDHPNAAVLFPYLFFVTAGIFALIRYRPWQWLAWLALAGNGLWHLTWAFSIGGEQDLVRALHLLALPTLAATLLLRDPWPAPAEPWWRWDWSKAPLPVWAVGATVLGGFGLLWLLAAQTGYDGTAATAWGIGLALLLILARWAPTQQPLLPVVAAMTVGLVATWTVPTMTPDPAMPWFLHGPILPPTLVAYVAPAAEYALIFAAGGFALLWRSSYPGLWASLSAATPLLLLALLYARLSGMTQSLTWAGAAIGLAAFDLFAAERAARQRWLMNVPLAAYAAAVTAAIALAATMMLHAAWLTVALALELPALAGIWWRTGAAKDGVPGLRILAGILTTILVVRLIFNPYLPDYADEMPILLNWLPYGYGVPIAACWAAARWFRQGDTEDWLTALLESAALAFGAAFMSLELWHVAGGGGRLSAHAHPLRQAAAIGAGWLSLGLMLLRLERNGSHPVRRWGWRLIGGGGLAWSLLVTLLLDNPLFHPYRVGSLPILNQILFAYGLPSLLLALGAFELARQRLTQVSRVAAVASVLFLIATVLLEIRQAFHGDRLDAPGIREAETYSYSAGMLLVSLGLLAVGLRWPKSDLRRAGFVLLALTLGKAFVIDLDSLTGLWRAASFLGLGLSLVGVGYAYQRLGREETPMAPATAQ